MEIYPYYQRQEAVSASDKGSTNDTMLMNYIRRELPEALQRMGFHVFDQHTMDTMAQQLTEYSKSHGVCLESLEKIELNTNLTPEEHQEFEAYLDQIIRQKFMYSSKKSFGHMVRRVSGIVWSKVVRFTGTEDKEWEHEDKSSGGGGIRG